MMGWYGGGIAWFAAAAAIGIGFALMADVRAEQSGLKLVFSANGDNDLYRVMTAAGGSYPRCASRPPACNINVDLPMPGSPPTSTVDPGEAPPPRTVSNSLIPVASTAIESADTEERLETSGA